MLSGLKRVGPKVFCVVALLLVCTALSEAYSRWGGSGGRHYYGTRGSNFYYGPYWGSGRNYYTYYYYYLPTYQASDYNYHTCFYYPQDVGTVRGGYYYYKNNVSNNYWGRCYPESSYYELLPPTSQRPVLTDIPQKDFVQQKEMPPIPNAEPKTPIIPPPQPTTPPAE